MSLLFRSHPSSQYSFQILSILLKLITLPRTPFAIWVVQCPGLNSKTAAFSAQEQEATEGRLLSYGQVTFTQIWAKLVYMYLPEPVRLQSLGN